MTLALYLGLCGCFIAVFGLGFLLGRVFEAIQWYRAGHRK